ncbi:MAG: branched-chain amino acid ABC transporter permease [Alphaproteobacteria bacterium]
MPDLATLLQTVLNALYASSYMALVAVGLVLIFGVMRIVNFAHGELYMAGAFAVYTVTVEQSGPFLLGLAVAVIVVALIGLAMERGLFRPMRDNPLGGLILSIGLLLILQSLAVVQFGVRAKDLPNILDGSLQLGIEGAQLAYERALVIGVAVLVLGLLYLFLRHTRTGWALRACAQDPEAAQLQGISVNRTAQIAVGLGAALAGIAGGLMAMNVPIEPYMGHSIIVAAFIVIIVGGIGSLEGAVVAAVLYAFVDTFVTTYTDGTVAGIVGLLLMLVVLVVKPTGLFGARERA